MNAMQPQQGIARELSLSEVFSKTFEIFRQGFKKYFVLFVVVEAIIGVVTAIAQKAFILPTLSSNPTPEQLFSWLPAFFGALIPLVAMIGIVSVIFFPIAQGSAIKLASEQIENKETQLGALVRYAASKLLSIWALNLIFGVIVILGFIALVIPGIILAIMYALSFPILLLEDKGILESMGRSRELVRHRWLKTFGTFFIFAIIVAIASGIVSALSGPFGIASPVVSGILSAFYQPLFPILLVVYYYSNCARVSLGPASQTQPAPTTTTQAGMRFCINCGTQMPYPARFCPNCGAKQPA